MVSIQKNIIVSRQIQLMELTSFLPISHSDKIRIHQLPVLSPPTRNRPDLLIDRQSATLRENLIQNTSDNLKIPLNIHPPITNRQSRRLDTVPHSSTNIDLSRGFDPRDEMFIDVRVSGTEEGDGGDVRDDGGRGEDDVGVMGKKVSDDFPTEEDLALEDLEVSFSAVGEKGGVDGEGTETAGVFETDVQWGWDRGARGAGVMR